MPNVFWAEAVATAAYVVKICPTKAPKDKTPYEAWFGKKPSVFHQGVFGCNATTTATATATAMYLKSNAKIRMTSSYFQRE